MAMDWLGDYSSFRNIIIGINAPRMLREVSLYLKCRNQWSDQQTQERVIYLPNYYPQEYKRKLFNRDKDHIDIACFGAIRPLKNHLVQAFAAIDFANFLGKKLNFHVNAGRIEINNLKGLFEQLHDQGHRLINHQWRPREDFLDLCASIDIGLQCNFSETFNIVGADLISQGVPLISNAKEIPWAIPEFCADPTDSKHITDKLYMTYQFPGLNVRAHQRSLTRYTDKTAEVWAKYFL